MEMGFRKPSGFVFVIVLGYQMIDAFECQVTMHTTRQYFLKDRCNSYCFSYF